MTENMEHHHFKRSLGKFKFLATQFRVSR